MSEGVGAARWFMRGLLLFVLAFANLNDIWSPDVLPNALFAWTVVREGNVDYDEFVYRPTESPVTGALDSEAYFFRACGESTATQAPKATRSPGGLPAPGPNDHVCSIFPPGNSHFNGMGWCLVRWQMSSLLSRTIKPAATCFIARLPDRRPTTSGRGS